MKLYIKGCSSFVSDGTQDIKKILKNEYNVNTRRQDAFIHLALYGAQLLKEQIQINQNDELYITSGVGDVEVVQKTNTSIYKENQPLMLFDFINLLGNTTSYYVAKMLNLKGKNIFQISDNFTYYHTLMSAYASIYQSKNDVIVGSVDLISTPTTVIKRVLGIGEAVNIVSSVNFQKFSLDKKDAIASIEFSNNLKEDSVDCKDETLYFETQLSYALNQAIQHRENKILSEKYENRTKFLKVKMV